MSAKTDKEFLTYLLLYATHADFKVDEEEREYIHSKVDEDTLRRVNSEFQRHNDIQRIDKVHAYLKAGDYTDEQKSRLIDEVMALFKSDGDYSITEQNLMMGLKRVLRG